MQSLFVLVALLVGLATCLPPLPNIGYLGSGYDLMRGNPHATDPEQGVDPGFQAFVFDLAIYNNTITPDNKYEVPFGVDVLLCDFCTLATDSMTVAGSSSYQESISREVSGKGSLFSFSFGGSYDFKSVSQSSSTYKDVFVETKAECCAYKSQISEYVIPPMSAEFTAAVKSLPLHYDQTAYMKFMSYFGTHAVTNMMMGGRLGMRASFTQGGWSQATSSTIDISASASFSLFSFSAAASAQTSTQKQMAANYQKFVNTTSLFIVGGQIDQTGTLTSWAASAASNPMPLSITIVPLSQLISLDYFPKMNKTELAMKQTAATTALTSYCPWLMTQGVVKQCTAPGPDPAMPKGSIFNGFYQNDDCGKDNIVNSFTNAMNCPTGSTPHQIGRVQAPESNCGANQFVCLVSGQATDAELNYAGNYQVCDKNTANNFPNPLTGGMSCPAGFSSVQTGRVYGPESKCGCNQFSCIDAARTPTYESTAGFYQVTDDDSADRIVNPFTSAASCPAKYCPVTRGRVKPPEARNGGTQVVCVACNLIGLF